MNNRPHSRVKKVSDKTINVTKKTVDEKAKKKAAKTILNTLIKK